MKLHSSANNVSRGCLSERIRAARQKAGLSQTELAKAIGVSASAVAQWESPVGTQPSLDHLLYVAQTTRVSLDWLASGNGTRSPSKSKPSNEVPAVMLEVYARNVQEETLLERFRRVPARRRELLMAIVEEFMALARLHASKRR